MWARPRPAPREMRAPACIDAGGDASVVALFYNDEIAALDTDERGAFSASRTPDRCGPCALTGAPPTRLGRGDVGGAAASSSEAAPRRRPGPSAG